MYETRVNSYIQQKDFDAGATGEFGASGKVPTFTFDAKEMYQESLRLCEQKPSWNNERDNPINTFMTTSEKPKIASISDLFGGTSKSSLSAREERIMGLKGHGRKHSLQLAATIALKNRKMSPQSKIRQRKGFVTATRVPDVIEDKLGLAKSNWTVRDKKTGQRVPKVYEYQPPRDPVFRVEKEIELGMTDFALRVKCDPVDNPHGLSAFEQRPKYQVDLENKEMREREAIDKFNRLGQDQDWGRYFKLPESKVDIGAAFRDKHNKLGARRMK